MCNTNSDQFIHFERSEFAATDAMRVSSFPKYFFLWLFIYSLILLSVHAFAGVLFISLFPYFYLFILFIYFILFYYLFIQRTNQFNFLYNWKYTIKLYYQQMLCDYINLERYTTTFLLSTLFAAL